MITILQHGKDEGPGTITEYLDAHNKHFHIIRLHEGERLPDQPQENLIVLGGQMSVNDEMDYSYLHSEKMLVRDSVNKGCVVLGVCLGAQMIAAACGEKVFACEKETGWKTVMGGKSGWDHIFPSRFEVFHWHGESFDLPKNAQLLVKGEVVTNQAFLINNALGVQFHPEVTIPIISTWAKDLKRTERELMIVESEKKIEGNRILCNTIMDAFCHQWTR